MKPYIRFVIGTALGIALGAEVSAQPWPQKPVRAVISVAAGSSTDIIPRLVFEELSFRLGQSIVVENRPGAGGTIGAAFVAKSDPNGYTLLASGSALTIAPSLYRRLSFDPASDFTAVVPFGISPNVLVVAPRSGFKTVADLVAAAKARPGALTFSSVGVGTATHLSAERFRLTAGINALHIPFKGGAEAMFEVIAGRVDFFFGPPALVGPHIADGTLLALAVNGTERAKSLPNVPTTLEAGFVDAEYPIWYGLFAPAKTDGVIVERLHREITAALQSPKLRDRLIALGIDPMPKTPREFAAYVQQEIALNAKLVEKVGIKID